LDLDEEQLVWAFGNAGTQATGLWQFNADGDMSKHLHAGRAAAGGVLAADLAKRNFSGARRILEGERGFFAATAPDAMPERVIVDLSLSPRQFKISGVSIKPHASCRHTHPAVDAALALRPQLNGRPVTQIKIHTYQAALDLCHNPDPQTPYAAKFSLHYCLASALQRGRAGLADFTAEATAEPVVRRLLPRITAVVDPEFEAQYPAAWPARVRLTLADGTILSATVAHPKGDPENPLTSQELENKFRQLARYGGHVTNVEVFLDWAASLASDDAVVL
jgi:2-methylcitrate dehydratase PrpD